MLEISREKIDLLELEGWARRLVLQEALRTGRSFNCEACRWGANPGQSPPADPASGGGNCRPRLGLNTIPAKNVDSHR